MRNFKQELVDGGCKDGHGCNAASVCLCGIIEDATDEIERLRAEWQPISTKPSFVHCEERGEYRTDDGSLWYFKPTHWRPLSHQQSPTVFRGCSGPGDSRELP